jgi:4-hydroxy-3-methylbut-2-enyl diphosphate reductase IspH|tara:strand:- start:51 stop:341 length:291 start_codon:yes stop_codon:yes gene_type:complete
MDIKDLLVPILSGAVAVGMTLATVTASAQDAEELSDRVRDIEVKQAGEESTKVIVKQNSERLERLENIIQKLAEQQSQVAANQAAICQATGADCSR